MNEKENWEKQKFRGSFTQKKFCEDSVVYKFFQAVPTQPVRFEFQFLQRRGGIPDEPWYVYCHNDETKFCSTFFFEVKWKNLDICSKTWVIRIPNGYYMAYCFL